MYLLRKGAYRDISHIILNTHNKQQVGNKSICTKKGGRGGGEVMTATNICSDFGGFRLSPPMVNKQNISSNIQVNIVDIEQVVLVSYTTCYGGHKLVYPACVLD